jgi:hypothetical protein
LVEPFGLGDNAWIFNKLGDPPLVAATLYVGGESVHLFYSYLLVDFLCHEVINF